MVRIGAISICAMATRNVPIQPMSIHHPMRSSMVTLLDDLRSTPAGLSCEDGIDPIAATAISERRPTVQGYMVVPPVKNSSIRHPVSGKGHDCANDGSRKYIIPVVILVNRQRTSDEHCSQDGRIDQDQLPHGGVVVGEDLELRIQVQVQVHEAGKGSRRVSAGERLEAVVDLLLVAGANVGREVQLVEALGVEAGPGSRPGDVGLADFQEMRAKTANEPFQKDLEDRRRDERVQQPDDAVVDVPEGSDANLHQEYRGNGHHGCEKRSQPDGNDLIAERIRELGIDDFAVGEGDGERARGRRFCHVDLDGYSLVHGLCQPIARATREEEGGEQPTPKPTAPMMAMVTISKMVCLNHCPNVGRECIV